MNKYIYKTPDGTRDFLFEECDVQNRIHSRLSALFTGRGYHQVITPVLEHFDLFSMPSAGLSQEEMYKLSAHNGHLVVLRPDTTMPIARLVSTRLKDAPLPIRLYYTQKVFRVHPDYKGRNNEVTQSGIELIGAPGLTADVEIIHTAARALEAVGIQKYKIEIGHAGVFKALCAELDAGEDDKEMIRLAIESKSYSTLEKILSAMPESRAVTALKILPRLFGGAETLDTAAELFGDIAREELSYLRTLIDTLSPELGSKITVDLGLVHRNNYYTGVVFRAYANGSGDTAVSGGRYDTLFGEFGKNLPAVGFAVDQNVLSDILLMDYAPEQVQEKHLVYPENGYIMQALALIDALSEKGATCELMDIAELETAKTAAMERGAAYIDVVGASVRTEHFV